MLKNCKKAIYRFNLSLADAMNRLFVFIIAYIFDIINKRRGIYYDRYF